MPVNPPSLKPWLCPCIGWLSAVVLFSEPVTFEILPSILVAVLAVAEGVGFKFGVEDFEDVCVASLFRGELWTGEDDCLLPADVRGETLPAYVFKISH